MEVYIIGGLALFCGAVYIFLEIREGQKNVAPYNPPLTQRELEQELFDRIMQEGTDQQKLVALQLQQNKKLDTLRGLILFDIFFK